MTAILHQWIDISLVNILDYPYEEHFLEWDNDLTYPIHVHIDFDAQNSILNKKLGIVFENSPSTLKLQKLFELVALQ